MQTDPSIVPPELRAAELRRRSEHLLERARKLRRRSEQLISRRELLDERVRPRVFAPETAPHGRGARW